jgi:hypothetical protein
VRFDKVIHENRNIRVGDVGALLQHVLHDIVPALLVVADVWIGRRSWQPEHAALRICSPRFACCAPAFAARAVRSAAALSGSAKRKAFPAED